LIGYSEHGCSDSLTKPVTVYPNPEVRFAPLADDCGPLSIALANQSIPNDTGSIGIMTFNWNLGNGLQSTSQDPSTTFLASNSKDTTYILKLTGYSEHGCIDSASQNITVFPDPTVLFTADNNSGCHPLPVQFTNTSVPNDTGSISIMTFQWDLGNTITTTSTDASTTYLQKPFTDTTFSVRLIGLNEHGCRDTFNREITVHPLPVPRFILDSAEVCGPLEVTFQADSIGVDEYYWDFGDGFVLGGNRITQTFQAIDLRDTLYQVRHYIVTDQNCMSLDTFASQVLVRGNPVAIIRTTPDSTCGPVLDSLLNGSQGATSFTWDFGNGDSSTQFNTQASYIASNTQDTTYSISMVASNIYGCLDTAYTYKTVFPNPTVAFDLSDMSGCGPLTINLQNNSIPNDTGTIAMMRFEWDLGNGLVSTAENPSVIYIASSTQDSIYSIDIKGYSEHECVDSSASTVTVYPDPIAQFSPSRTQGCGPLDILFVNQSYPNNGGIIDSMTFDWEFGNGLQSTSQNPSTQYLASLTNDSIYTVKLIGYSEHGCIDSISQNITVFPDPTVLFIADNYSGCHPLPVKFTNVSIPNGTGSISMMTFQWNLGNYVTATSTDASTTYFQRPLADTTYTVRLIGLSEHGCRDTFNREITVHPLPAPRFTTDNAVGCGPLEVIFLADSIGVDEYYWDFGNGFVLGSNRMTQTFHAIDLKDTVYNVRHYLVTDDQCGSLDTFITPVLLRANPIAEFKINNDSICRSATTVLSNNSLGGSSYIWDFGTGDSAFTYNAIYNYIASTPYSPMPRTFSIKQEVETFFGCKDNIRKDIYLFPDVEAHFTVDEDSACAPLNATFTNNSLNHDFSYWEFGDGDTSTAEHPSHRFDNYFLTNITNEVVLNVSNIFGCEDLDTLNVVTIPVPYADFIPLRRNICDSGYFDFDNRSYNATSYSWDFGDGGIATSRNPEHRFDRNITGDANYNVTLHVSNDFGCVETVTRPIDVPILMIVSFDSLPFKRICEPGTITVNNTSINSEYQIWEFTDGGIKTEYSPTHIFAKPGTYGATLISFDKNFCPDSFSAAAIVEILERPKANFTYNPSGPRIPDALVNFINLSTPSSDPLSSLWNFGDNTATSGNTNPSHTYLDSGSYTVTLIVDNGLCQDTARRNVYVIPPLPLIDFDVSGDEGCGPLTVQFTELTQNATEFNWYFDDGSISTEANPTHTYSVPGYYNVTLQAYNDRGEGTVLTQDSVVRVYPKPFAYFLTSTRQVYLPNADVYLIDGSIDATTYAYEIVFDDDPSRSFISTEKDPLIRLSIPGTYSITQIVTNSFGCKDTLVENAHVVVEHAGSIIIPTGFTPNGNDLNETFKPILTGVSEKNYVFKIFNHWGEKLYETNDISESWDGIFKGKPVQQGVYLWLIEGVFLSGETFDRHGNITLLR
tara:strand:+ start:256 stop:4512 length:4257 start_codon:yes stop_codon:yes gene_type:complete